MSLQIYQIPTKLNVLRFKRFHWLLMIIICFVVLLNTKVVFASNRIISLIPSSTELLFAIGYGDEIIAVSNYCNYPEDKIKNLPRIGDQNLNVEKIISLSPTILVDTNSIHKRYESIFKKLKLNYVNIDIKTHSDVPKVAYWLAEQLGDKSKANPFVNEWNKEITSLNSNNLSKKIRIYAEIGSNPIVAVGGNNNIDSIITFAGGKNVLANHEDYPLINSEMVLLSNPEIIILIYPDANIDSVKNRLGWKKIKAVQNNYIYAVDQDLFVRPGPRNLQAIRIVNNLINKVIENESN